ncbi:MAG: PstS family phosphate ABC transporter substrate-binding protein [Planctomycetes bacterium]|nr:PstS family phosphate ABC transporter substrate-binding protein [Planctomycetota bacterium]
MNRTSLWLLAAAAFCCAPALESKAQETEKVAAAPRRAEDQAKVDANLPSYGKVAGISGNLNSIGSDTLNNLMTLWSESFKGQYPSVRIQVEGKGSGSAPPALIAGTAQLGPMSREMKSSEIDDFEGKYGYKPTQVRVCVDALAVYVHKDNPIEKLTIAQVDALFGKQRKQGAAKSLETWGDLGLTGEWAALPISLYGRNSASGTYGFFKELVLKNGDYKDTVKEQPGSASVVLGVTEDRGGVGYSGIGYKTSGVRAVPIAKDDATPAGDTGATAVYGGKYPITRFLYVYVNKAPNKPLDPLTKEFLIYVLSQQGQQAVLKDGYFPLPAKLAAEELKKLQ